MGAFEEMEWMMAQGDFIRATEEFEEATDQFNTAVRFGEEEESLRYFARAEEKAEALWRAAEWLADAARAYASGEGVRGETMRSDAETPLEEARDIHEPPSPDDFPPEGDPADRDADEEDDSILPTEDEGAPASLEGGLDPETPEAEEMDDEEGTGPIEGTPADSPTANGTADSDDADEDEEIAAEELEEIAAELEAQTEQSQATEAAENTEHAGEGVVPDGTTALTEDGDGTETAAGAASVEPTDPPGGSADGDTDKAGSDGDATDSDDAEEGDLDEDDIELDLADPTEGKDVEPDEPAEFDDEDEEDEIENGEDFGSGDHGVPDSL
jgi:hypothetical protein